MSYRSPSTLLLACLALAACDKSSRHGPRPAEEPVPLERALGSDSLLQDPNLGRPGVRDELDLIDYDAFLESLSFVAGINTLYDPWMNDLLDRVSISTRVRVNVVEDFRHLPDLEAIPGAATGHRLILLDGKLLDALLEYATFLALYERGLEVRDPVAAADEIIFLHNDFLGATTGGFLYPFFEMPGRIQADAESIFLAFAGTLLYQEFGHIFLLHTRDALRELGALDFVNQPLRFEEDRADLIAGMLSSKAGCDLALSIETLDLWTFYAIQREDRNFFYDEVLSPVYQSALLFEQFSPLTARKSRLARGFDRFEGYWF